MKTYPSKIDPWLPIVLLGVPVLAAVAVLFSGPPQFALAPLLTIGLIIALTWPCEYIFDTDKLIVRSGLFKWRVPYDKIERVYPTRSPLSSPALSLDRVAIHYGRSMIMVSPDAKREFIETLVSRARLNPSGREYVR